MYKAKTSSNITNIFSFSKYQSQILNLMGFVILSLMSISSHALAPNPGATCPADSFQGSFTNSDYNNLVTNRNNNTYFNVAGNASGNIPLQAKVDVTESNPSNINIDFSMVNNSLNIGRNFPDIKAYTDTKLTFRNSITQQPIYLTNMAISTFDTDFANQSSWFSYNAFHDYVIITGVTSSDSVIAGSLQPIAGSYVNFRNSLLIDRDFNCNSANFDTRCQGSIQFSQPVTSVNIRYTNDDSYITASNPTEQEIQLRVDSYCYLPVPSYSITKDDGVASIGSGNMTNYTIKVTNTGGNTLSNIVLKDPAVNGLSKESGISCDNNDASSICTSVPTVSQLESATGFNLPSLPVGKSYSIKVPTRVTAAAGSNITNTATISHSTLARKSATDTNSVTSAFNGGSDFTPASCPANHRMYYVGATAPNGAYRSIPLSGWTSGSKSKVYSFNEGSTFTISFTSLIEVDTSYTPTPPFYGNITNATQNALNVVQNSTSTKANHVLSLSINKPVSKLGYVIQDLDSTSVNGQTPYQEQVDVSASGGNLTYNQTYHTINPANNIVTSIRNLNCSTVGACPINATWGYKAANNPFNLTHNNALNETSGAHAVGYSDFYFCLAPPKVVVTKALTGTRINDTTDNRDQFTISVNNGSNTLSSFETSGSGQTITSGSSGAIILAESTSYTITERVTGSAMGDITNYNATYTCTNSTAGSPTVMPTSAMTYNSSAKTRSFTLPNVSYGDEITCTITNSPASYTFSGFVFNDNGGIAASEANRQNISTLFTGNKQYFNGKLDAGELGIYENGLQVKLTDCGADDGGTNIAGTTAKNVSDAPATLGQFKFTVPASALAGKSRVCLVQTEPSAWKDSGFSVDTTSNSREVTLVNGTLDYKTENDGSRNLDFGEVVKSQSALVLIKSQYLHACNDTLDFMNSAINQPTSNPMVGFSDQPPQTSVEPGNCIAYRIDAYNRGHVDIRDVQITDELQQTPVKSVFHLPYPKGSSSSVYDNTGSLPMGTIVSKIFNLDKPTGTSATKATLYFNTKYGTTNGSNP